MDKEALEKLGIEPQWFNVQEIGATLIKKGGNPNNGDDRVAFIEKSPRVLLNGVWVYGPKGQGGDYSSEDVYGKFQPSRDWCEKQLIENYK